MYQIKSKIKGNIFMNFSPQKIKKALEELNGKYPDSNLNNKTSNGGSVSQIISDQTYEKISMKRSRFQNISYKGCTFDNVAFSASSYHNVTFEQSKLSGNSFSCCNFFNSVFINKKVDDVLYIGNNFSQSSFTACNFKKITFKSSGFLQSLFYNCRFDSVKFQSNTLEGSCFNSCCLEKIDAGHTNVEFIELLNTSLKSVVFPFYQFAYIIGASDFLNESSTSITFVVGDKEVSLKEYIHQIDNLIYYYDDKQEYFPVCNLLIAKGKMHEAQDFFLNGINQALDTLDFRMLRHLCRLAKRHDLLDEITVRRASKKIENYLYDDNIPPERINDYIVNTGEIRKILLSGKSDSVTYSFNIRTNICKKNKEGVAYVNSLSTELNDALSQNDFGQIGFQVAVSNHSPFEIIIDVVCAAGALATVAQLIWSIVEKKQPDTNSNNQIIPDDYVATDNKIYAKCIDTYIERSKEQLLNIKSKYSEKKMNQYIEQVTQQLKTDIADLYNKDVMIFMKKNTDKT